MLRLDTEYLRARIDRLFGGNVARVVNRWPAPKRPHRSTIHRWLDGATMPRTQHEILGLASALDLDPFALWAIAPETFPKLCARVVTASRQDRWGVLLPSLSFLQSFVGPMTEWPPAPVRAYFGRDWSVREFSHDPDVARNYYATLALDPAAGDVATRDQIWHFAWRTTGGAAVWRPYGFVRVVGVDLRLWTFTGLARSTTLPDASAVQVQTWFGEGPATFRIASLNRFTLTGPARLPEPDDCSFRFPA